VINIGQIYVSGKRAAEITANKEYSDKGRTELRHDFKRTENDEYSVLFRQSPAFIVSPLTV
jgi:hypothetical protein